MASSDDEGELVAHSVSNYHFVDEKDEPISFSVLPIQWSGDENLESMKRQVFLHGTADDGLQKLYKQVKAWKFELSDEHPEISVLSKERNWIKLQKPRKSFEDIVRTILITVRCLGFVKKNPKILGGPLWDNLRKFFSTYEVWPSEKDLLDHISLIHDVVKRDEGVSKSKYLLTFLENPKKRTTLLEGVLSAPDTKKSKFIVDEEEEPPKDNDACAICDNGGELVCCDGRCLRSFHGTVAEGKDSHCQSLCLSKAQMKGTFMCANCRYKQHQCYACGKLGSSDQYIGAEVFPCVSATCGHFYHPECVAKLLYPGDESEAEKLQNKIAAGESFTCSAHRCHVCKKSENADFRGLCFALCRRCPKAYHRECLPRKIAFEDLDDEGIITRAWENLLPNNRVLIYCLKHKIDKRIGTPFRNIIFPNDERQNQTLDPQSNKRKVMEKGRSVITENEKDSEGKDDTKKRQKYLSEKGFDSSDKPKTKHISRKPFKDGLKSSMQLENGTTDASRVLLGEDKFPHKGPELVKSNQQKISTSKFEKTIRHVVPLNKQSSPQSLTTAKTRTKIATLMEQIASSITLEKVVKNHKVPSTYASSLKNLQDKAITLGKVDVSVKAVRIALQKLEDGCSVEDAKAVCGPEILNQLIKWRNKLKVCLAPFLHGMRYTSFGRHFTKLDKLKEIVDKLHWYVQKDDVIVDFSCGANDFSWLMKEKLNETGKKCSFKNYDIIQPKNDFNFEKRDWFTVCLEDLPTGSKLIMGLNPPFGVKAALANKFIDKALEFEPKLLILIVPEETERLDKKEAAYDLIWEDDQKLSGKSFYLPGSVDVNDNQMDQWNVKPPLLHLWSRPDWTAEHMIIALKHGHLLKDEVEVHVEKNHDESEFHYPMDISPDHEDPIDISMPRKDHGDISGQINYMSEEQNEAKPEESKSTAHRKWSKSSLPEHDTAANRNRYGYESTNNQNYHSVKRRPFKNPKVKNKGNPSRRAAVTPPVGRNDHDLSPAMDTPTGTPAISSQHIQADAETLPEGRPYNQHGIPATGLDDETGYRGIRTSIQGGDFDRVARSNSSTPFASGTDGWSAGTRVGRDEYGIHGLDARMHYRRREPNEYRNDTDVQHLLRRYDRQNDSDYSAQRSHLHGLDSGFSTVDSLSFTPYGVPGLASDPTYGGRLSSLTMQRYAPHLDELNHRRIGPFGSETPVMGRSSIVDRIQNPPTTRTGFHPDSLGYASGTWRPFSYQ